MDMTLYLVGAAAFLLLLAIAVVGRKAPGRR
jgi:hypothetical protein